MGRESLLDNSAAEGFRVPIIKEASVNQPSVSEITRRPDTYEGMKALGETIHRAASPTIDRILATLGRERNREMREVSGGDPEGMSMALVEDVESGINDGLEGAEDLERHALVLEDRVEGRDAIIDRLEAGSRN